VAVINGPEETEGTTAGMRTRERERERERERKGERERDGGGKAKGMRTQCARAPRSQDTHKISAGRLPSSSPFPPPVSPHPLSAVAVFTENICTNRRFVIFPPFFSPVLSSLSAGRAALGRDQPTTLFPPTLNPGSRSHSSYPFPAVAVRFYLRLPAHLCDSPP